MSGEYTDGSERSEMHCWMLRYEDRAGRQRERIMTGYPCSSETNPDAEIVIAGWSA